jgi:hypothetical protein
MNNSPPVRPGITSITLLLIIVITAAWWALAFWPAGAVESAWLARTRAICFGSNASGLPDVGGWIVLIGEPLGMLGALFAVWGTALRADLKRLYAQPMWRATMGLVALVAILGIVKVSQHVATAAGLGERFESPSSMPSRVDVDMSSHKLVDQFGVSAHRARCQKSTRRGQASGHSDCRHHAGPVAGFTNALATSGRVLGAGRA